jgi:hypothetical protein
MTYVQKKLQTKSFHRAPAKQKGASNALELVRGAGRVQGATGKNMRVSRKTSPYVHVIKVVLRTATCGISREQGKISYIVEISFGATGLQEFSTSTQKEERGERKDSLN